MPAGTQNSERRTQRAVLCTADRCCKLAYPRVQARPVACSAATALLCIVNGHYLDAETDMSIEIWTSWPNGDSALIPRMLRAPHGLLSEVCLQERNRNKGRIFTRY
jgi:hypothetical protein